MGGVDTAISTPTFKPAVANIPFMNNVVKSCNPIKLITHVRGSRSTLIHPSGFLVPMTAFPLLWAIYCSNNTSRAASTRKPAIPSTRCSCSPAVRATYWPVTSASATRVMSNFSRSIRRDSKTSGQAKTGSETRNSRYLSCVPGRYHSGNKTPKSQSRLTEDHTCEKVAPIALRGRAVAARRAHNPEVAGSNPAPAT